MKADFHSVLHAVRALDPEGKGYFDYNQFSKSLTPGIADRIASKSDITLPDVGPSKNRIAENIRRAAIVT